MYYYTPKKKSDTKKLLILMAIIFIGMIGADILRKPLHQLINDYHEKPLNINIFNKTTEEYNPCDLDSVVCKGETINITEHSEKDIIDRILQSQFGNNWKLARAIMMSEGKYNRLAYNPTNNSHDRGLFQISRKYHPEVTDECAYNIECNIREAYRISQGGTDWSPWYGYSMGGYKQFL